MQKIEQAAAALQAIANGIDKTANDAAAAEANAQQIAARAAAHGFLGVAQGMHQVQTILQQLTVQLRTASRHYREAAACVAAAGQERSPEHNIATLSAGQGKAGAAFTGLTAGLHTLADTQRMTATVLHGGQPAPMLARLDAIKQLLVGMAQHGTEARQGLESAISEAKQTGRVGSSGA